MVPSGDRGCPTPIIIGRVNIDWLAWQPPSNSAPFRRPAVRPSGLWWRPNAPSRSVRCSQSTYRRWASTGWGRMRPDRAAYWPVCGAGAVSRRSAAAAYHAAPQRPRDAGRGNRRYDLLPRATDRDAVNSGQPLGKVNFVLRDSKQRIWLTVTYRTADGALKREPGRGGR